MLPDVQQALAHVSGDFSSHRAGLRTSRKKLLKAIGPVKDLTLITFGGNTGDQLIWAGTRRLLAGRACKSVTMRALNTVSGDTALIVGSGGWCAPYHRVPEYLRLVEQRFARVIVLPSSFDPSVKVVGEALLKTRAKVFARELASFALIKDLCDADAAYDGAFFFDFAPYRKPGHGVLNAYRTDRESRLVKQPGNNVDISLVCKTVRQWLGRMARYAVVRTDRAHVMIAAAMLGKRVYYHASSYHKVPAIAAFSLQGFPVYPHAPR